MIYHVYCVCTDMVDAWIVTKCHQDPTVFHHFEAMFTLTAQARTQQTRLAFSEMPDASASWSHLHQD